MRIKPHEYEDMVSLLKQLNIPLEEILFVKKKGWFTIKRNGNDGIFEFHRKLETHIVEGKFVDELSYRCKFSDLLHQNISWKMVLYHLKEWLLSN